MSQQIFISYNQNDAEVAREVGLLLVAHDVGVWFDEWRVAAGDSIIEQIQNGLGGCTHFILLWSANASKSNWVRKELRAALTKALEHEKPRIVPLILDNTPVPELLRDIRYIRWQGSLKENQHTILTTISGSAPNDSHLRAFVKKYHQLIRNDEADSPFRLAACPQCGSTLLRFYVTDPDGITPGNWHHVTCDDCGWSDLTSEFLDKVWPKNRLR